MKITGNKLFKTIALSALLSLGATHADAIILNFAATGDSEIAFDGAGNFSFVDSTTAPVGYDFTITGQVGGTGSSVGLNGNLGGSFAIGTISGSTAPVTGAGTLSIDDGTFVLTANVDWVDIMQTGAIGGLNTMATVNLSAISYGGSNADLLAMLSPSQTGVATVTFQFTTPMTLAGLKSSPAMTSYSGSLTAPVGVPDGGSSLILLGAAMVAVNALRKRQIV